MSEVQTIDLSKIKAETRTMADVIKSKLTLGDAGVIAADKALFDEAMKSIDLDKETVKKAVAGINLFSAGLDLAVGELSADAYKVDKQLTSTSVEVKAVPGLAFSASNTRNYTVPNGDMQNPAMVPAWGRQVAKIVLSGNNAERKVIRKHIGSLVKDAE